MNESWFSRSIPVAHITADGKHFHVDANPQERERFAQALGILGVEALAADLDIARRPGDAVAVRGSVSAQVVQADVVTLDPIREEVVEAIDLVLVPEEQDEAGHRGAKPAEEGEGDVYRNGRIDLGAIVGEHVALGLNPYPRAQGVEFHDHLEPESAEDTSPFAKLGRSKDDI